MRRPDDFLSSCAVLRASRLARLPILLIAALASLYARAVAAQTPPPDMPVVVLTSTTVTATHAHPGGKVLFYGVGLETGAFESMARRWSTMVTSDGNGSASLTLDDPMLGKMIWVVADLHSGQYTIATPDGFPILSPERAKTFRTAPSGTIKQLMSPGSNVDALYIAATDHAWTLQTKDGWSLDRDGAGDGVTVIEAHDFTPLISGDSAPTDFTTGASLIVIDFFDMSVYDATLNFSGGGQ